MHLDLYAGIAINAAQRDSMYRTVAGPAERGTTTAAETQAPPWRSLEVSEIAFAIGHKDGISNAYPIIRA